MKVAFIAPMDKRTGISKYSYELSSSIQGEGVFSSIIYQPEEEDFLLEAKDRPIKKSSITSFMFNIRQYDIIHFQLGNSLYHHFQNHFLFVLDLFPRKSRIVITIHDKDSDNCLKKECWFCKLAFNYFMRRQKALRTLDNSLNRIFSQQASCLIAHSLFFNKKSFNPKRKELSPLIIVAGHIHPSKSVETAVEALKLLHDENLGFRSIFLGSIGDEPYLTHIQDQILRYGLEEKIKIIGFVKEKDFINHFLEADIVVISRKEKTMESSGMLINALSAGVTVVVPDDGSFPEYIQQDRGGFYKRKDPLSLAKELKRLLQDDQLRKRLAENAARYAETELSATEIARRHIRLYQELLNG